MSIPKESESPVRVPQGSELSGSRGDSSVSFKQPCGRLMARLTNI